MPDKKPTSEDGHFRFALELVEEVRSRQMPWRATWWQNIATYLGDLFVEYDIHKNRLQPQLQRPEHRVRLPINLAQPAIRTEFAKLTKNRPIIDPIPTGNEEKELNAAEVSDGMLNNYAEQEFHLPRVRRRMLMWTLLCGLGGIFTDWDETAGDILEIYEDKEGNVVTDEAVIQAYINGNRRDRRKLGIRGPIGKPKGELSIKEISPMAMGWDMSATYIDEAKWCFVSEVYEVEEVNQRWGKTPSPNPEAVPGILEHRMLSQLDLTGNLQLRPIRTQKLCVVHRLFVKPGHPWYPKGAEIVFTDEEVLRKRDFPYKHRQLPLSVMGHIPLPIGPYSMSILQQLRGPVLEISRTASQLIENRNLMANPVWRIPKQLQIKGDSIQNKPGGRIEYTHIPNVPPPEPVAMPPMPSYVSELIPVFKDFIQLISGQGETSQGQSPAGVRSGVQIAYLQEADDTRLGPTAVEYEETIERSHGQILELMAQFYTLPRTVVLYERHSENQVLDFQSSMIAGRIRGVKVQAGSALPRAKAAKQQFTLELWDRKIETDPRQIKRMLELGEGEADPWEDDINQAEREDRQLQKGEKPQVLEWYNHQAHQLTHRKIMKEAGFEEFPEEIKQAYYAHDQLHTNFLQREQMEQAKMEMMKAGSPGQSPPQTPQEAPTGPPSAPEGPEVSEAPEGAPEGSPVAQ